MDRDVAPQELRALATLSAEERQLILSQLHRVVVRLIDELDSMGRIDLIEPLHNLSKLLRAASTDIANSEAFREVVASVAQLVRTVRNVTVQRPIVRTFH